jgi:hypothetical protein
MKNEKQEAYTHDEYHNLIENMIQSHLQMTKLMVEEYKRVQDSEKYGIMGFNPNSDIIDL